MAVTQHTPVNPERNAATALAAIEDSLVLPNFMQKEGIDQFKGAKNGAVNIKVEGVLPYREYGWKNDRTNPIAFDSYAERSITVNFQGDIYSAVQLIDEQATMDAIGWDRLAVKQGEAVGRGIEQKALTAIKSQSYDVGVLVNEGDMRGALVYLRRVANALKVPGKRVLVISPDFEMALLNDPDLTIAANVGDARAAQAVQDATLGRLLGFEIVVAPELGGAGTKDAYLFIDNAFVVATGAPVSPASVKHVATKATPNGFATRWLTDYDANYLTDRSVVNTYVGFRAIKDPVITTGTVNGLTGQAIVSSSEYLIRAVEIDLGASNAIEIADGTLAGFMGMSSTDGTNNKAADATPTPGATV